jgi:hypothetical protein
MFGQLHFQSVNEVAGRRLSYMFEEVFCGPKSHFMKKMNRFVQSPTALGIGWAT